ncbi:HNH endonuclease [Cryobacterium lyxosi]|uniref:HNH endonuclease n=1 Tax=Cryobacterium lyxosi TaxID=1259228 RepID=A0A4R8ZFV8_9MICO|nr:HNH endonuclease [Cryobacterium lyxosi]TFD25169.1 HNH endonuclease [Cryobacterium lyxosi]
MTELHDYLGLDRQSAVLQWSVILNRGDLEVGRRQESYTPVETLLVFGLAFVVNRGSYGTANLGKVPEPLPTIARLFRRSVSSILAKMGNLDGSRTNGARNEIELAGILGGNLSSYFHLYDVIIDTARSIGLDSQALPDFLGLDSMQGVLGADKVTEDELAAHIEPLAVKWLRERPEIELITTEKLLMGSARIGQARFARAVLTNWNQRCAFCGLTLAGTGLPSGRMLIASHIKPWRHSSNRERLDHRNGLALCPTHDAAFDTFLISVQPDMTLRLAPALEMATRSDPIIARNFGIGVLAGQLHIDSGAVAPRASYLEWHLQQLVREPPEIADRSPQTGTDNAASITRHGSAQLSTQEGIKHEHQPQLAESHPCPCGRSERTSLSGVGRISEKPEPDSRAYKSGG